MILTVDIGNTTISYGLFKGKKLIQHKALTHAEFCTKGLGGLFRKKPDLSMALVVSVVPKLMTRVTRDLTGYVTCPVYVVGKDITITIPHTYKNIKTLGSDRLVALYGSLFIYQAPFLLIDCGTAITCDIVDEMEVYQGGIIVPGIVTSFNALKAEAAQLPQELSLSWPRSFPSKNTRSAMNAGVLYGFTALVDGLITRFKNKYGKSVQPVLTGGSAKHIVGHTTHKTIYNPELIHQSLVIIAQLIVS